MVVVVCSSWMISVGLWIHVIGFELSSWARWHLPGQHYVIKSPIWFFCLSSILDWMDLSSVHPWHGEFWNPKLHLCCLTEFLYIVTCSMEWNKVCCLKIPDYEVAYACNICLPRGLSARPLPRGGWFLWLSRSWIRFNDVKTDHAKLSMLPVIE